MGRRKKLIDRKLVKDIDQASMIHLRMHPGEGEFLHGYGYLGKGPKNYIRSDEKIREEVNEAIYLSYDVDGSKIFTDVEEGVVYLRGEVLDREMKRAAEDCADSVFGVLDVKNELEFLSVNPIVGEKIIRPENEFGTRLS